MTFVMIWNNNMVSSKLARFDNARTHEFPGHAALQITDMFDKIWHRADDGSWDLTEDVEYVSWIPSSDESHRARKREDEYGATHYDAGMMNESFFADLGYEGYAPDHIIHIPSDRFQENRMKAKRLEVISKPGGASYRFNVKNCSDIASRILKAGFSGRKSILSSFFYRKKIIWTPLEVKRLALHLPGARTVKWRPFLVRLMAGRKFDMTTCDHLKAFQRRSNTRGSSNAPARFVFSGGKGLNFKNRQKTVNAKNKADFYKSSLKAQGAAFHDWQTWRAENEDSVELDF